VGHGIGGRGEFGEVRDLGGSFLVRGGKIRCRGMREICNAYVLFAIHNICLALSQAATKINMTSHSPLNDHKASLWTFQ
jgi:hypothetical protein